MTVGRGGMATVYLARDVKHDREVAPADCIIRIYSSSGVLVTLLEHHSVMFGGAETWNVRSRNNQVVASGVYFYHVESGDARRAGRFTVVNFAE